MEDMNKALEMVNARYDGNIEFKRLEHRGRKIIFTLKVKAIGKLKKGEIFKGAGRAFTNNRRTGAACWHVHGHFFEAILSICPDAVITSMLATVSKDGGNWNDKEIGSPFHGYKYMSELCDCGEWGNSEDVSITENFNASSLKTAKVRTVSQSNLTGECWTVQFSGLKACDTCEYKDTEDCGGQNIRKTGKNELGLKVPL